MDDVVRLCGVDSSRLEVIHHGLDHDRFHPGVSGSEVDELHRQFVLPDRPFVFWLGMLDPKKNLQALLRAFESDLLLDASLVIAGGAAWRSEALISEVRRIETETAGRVSWIGPVPDDAVAPLMRAADVFCFPSAYEGFGMPVLEAQACGTPVVTSTAPAIVENLGSSALLVDVSPSGGPIRIARALREVLDNDGLRSQLSQAGLANAARFRWETSVEHHAHVLAEAAHRRPSQRWDSVG